MAHHKKNSTAVATYGDHEVITPENMLRRVVSAKPPAPDEPNPVERAEKALAELSTEFSTWMDSECERLDAARRNIATGGFTAANRDAVFHAAHDIKGEAATFGFPLVALAADSLCRLIEHSPDVTRIPIMLVDQHVDAVRAIHREYARSDATALAATLTKRLRVVTDEFLLHENRDRPDVLEHIKGPTIAAGISPAASMHGDAAARPPAWYLR
jgi:HPt (histidine-containing phosphotransfer) domain-containing protein